MKLNGIINSKGFSLLELVITIIIIGISMSAIVESFLVGAGQSLKIANREVAANLAKETMSQVYYCMYGGDSCGNTTPPPLSAAWSQSSSSALNAYLDGLAPGSPFSSSGTGYDFTTSINASFINGAAGPGTWSYNPPPPPLPSTPTPFIMVTVTTSWYNANGGSSRSPGNPSVVLSAVFANY